MEVVPSGPWRNDQRPSTTDPNAGALRHARERCVKKGYELSRWNDGGTAGRGPTDFDEEPTTRDSDNLDRDGL